jgi:uncharacterized repeat protein (TIGR04076 family)
MIKVYFDGSLKGRSIVTVSEETQVEAVRTALRLELNVGNDITIKHCDEDETCTIDLSEVMQYVKSALAGSEGLKRLKDRLGQSCQDMHGKIVLRLLVQQFKQQQMEKRAMASRAIEQPVQTCLT